MLKKYRIIFIFFTLLFIVGCDSNDHSTEPTEHENEVMEVNYQNIIEPNNVLGFQMLEHVDPVEDNVFISPTSALMAILIAYNGADVDTKQEMAETLNVKDLTEDEVNGAILALTNRLGRDLEDIELSIANSIWLNDAFHFQDDFSQRIGQYFNAQHEMINIKDNASVDQMNDWVSEATNDKITEMVEKPLSPDFVAMILNAIYFNGKWQHPFDEVNTSDAPFFIENEEFIIPFMMLEEELPYLENDLFQAVQLPYGSGEMSLQVFLPNEDVGMESFLNELTETNWSVWKSEFQPISGTIRLPKFQIEYETSLNDAFQKMGMDLAFDVMQADFPNMIEEDEQIYIHEIKQKTYIDVTEEGTEAAGSTSVEMRLTSAIIEDTFYMEVNRPFFFTITDEETNAILFMGIIKNPKQE